MMNVAVNRQTRRTVVHSNRQSPQMSSQTAACCYHDIGKRSANPVLQGGRGLHSGLGEVTASVIIDSDCTWNAYIGDKKVPDTCAVLARFRSSPLTDDKLTDVIKAIDSADLCPGNPDEKFISACKDKGGIVRGARGNGDVIASIHNSAVIDHSGKQYQCTVRRVDCDMLCEKSSQYPLHCRSCQSFRSTLHSMVSR